MSRTSLIGGEEASRGFFGGQTVKGRPVAVGIALTLGVALTLFGSNRLVGFVLLVILVTLAWVATAGTHNGSLAQRFITRARWRDRTKTGVRQFVPFDQGTWDAISEAYFDATTKTQRCQVLRDQAALREWPDGVVGMHWLEDRYAKAGIAWHRPPGQEAYLSVVFSTVGQVAGMESDMYLDTCAKAVGDMYGRFGTARSLIGRVQSTTRLLPIDSARHESWIHDNLDPATPDAFQESYEHVIAELRDGKLAQRHFITVSWPITGDFLARAGRHGADKEGWLTLMDMEVNRVLSALRTAHFGDVKVLSATKTAAVLRHLQHPGFPIDRVVDITPQSPWLPSVEEYAYVANYGAPDGPATPITGWLTATARITAPNVAISARGSLWLAPLLTSLPEAVVRTVSFHLELIPQQDARDQAEQDQVADLADQRARKKRGQLADDATETNLQGAALRRRDLGPGKRNQGAAWVGYVSVSATSRDELRAAVDVIEAAAAGEPAINQLVWLDTQHATAAACTWPVGRGITASKRLLSAQGRSFLAGKGAKEAL